MEIEGSWFIRSLFFKACPFSGNKLFVNFCSNVVKKKMNKSFYVERVVIYEAKLLFLLQMKVNR